MNLMLRWQKNQNKLFKIILLANELYIKFYLFFFRSKISPSNYFRFFSVHETNFTIRTLITKNLNEVYSFFKYSINTNSSDFLMPHSTDLKTLKTIFNKTSHIPLGIFYRDMLIGYALIRLFFPKKASYAIFISEEWQGKGIGTAALEKQINLINDFHFMPYSAVSKKNVKSLKMLRKLNIEFGNNLGDYLETKNKIKN